MNFSSWFRRSISTNNTTPQKPDPAKQSNQQQEEEEQLGVTEQLIDLIKSFSLDTFKNFPLKEDEGSSNGGDVSPSTSANVRKDLSEWQERHATLVLSKVKEISQLRYMSCPRHLKEQQFWRIYFMLVKSHVAECCHQKTLCLCVYERERGCRHIGKLLLLLCWRIIMLEMEVIHYSHFDTRALLSKGSQKRYELRAIRLAKLRSMAMENEKSSDKSPYEVEMAETKQATSAAPPTPVEHNLDSLDGGSRNEGPDDLTATGGDLVKTT